jgi:hypothetical protein
MNNFKILLIAILTGLFLVGCSSESTESRVGKELALGCEAIRSSKSGWLDRLEVNQATPHFAVAARLNPDYLVLIDKTGDVMERDMGYRTYKASQANSWLLRFCAGLEKE